MLMQDSILYWRKLSQYVFFSPFTHRNAFILLLIAHFYSAAWMLQILAPYALFFFFSLSIIKGQVMPVWVTLQNYVSRFPCLGRTGVAALLASMD